MFLRQRFILTLIDDYVIYYHTMYKGSTLKKMDIKKM